MFKKSMMLLGLIFCMVGCTTTGQDQTLTTQLQMKVGDMERQLDSKDKQIDDLEFRVKDLSYEVDRLRAQDRKKAQAPVTARMTKGTLTQKEDGIIRVDVPTENIQQALKAGGYYTGNIDGKIGNQTKEAIKKFQKDHGLVVDGIIGQKTWSELKTYLD